MMSQTHFHYCKICKVEVTMFLNHVGSWTPTDGCGKDCAGTFSHPRGRCPMSDQDLYHSDVFLVVKDHA